MKRYILMTLLLLATFSGCKNEDMNKSFMPFDKVSALKYFENSTEYSEWYRLMVHSGEAAAYNFSTASMTFFMVKNDVLLQYIKDKYGYGSVDEMDREEAKKLLLYHTIPNKVYALSAFRDGKLADSTSSGDYLSCMFVAAGNGQQGGIYMNRTCKIVYWDIEVVNGILHELNQVIDPVDYDLYGFFEKEGRFNIFKQAFEVTGNVELLTELNIPELPLKRRRTMFAVSDEIFAASEQNITDIEKLKEAVSPGRTDYTDPENPLNKYVRYHVMEGDYTTKELGETFDWKPVPVNGSAIVNKQTGFTLPTLAENKLILIQPEDGGISFVFNKTLKFVGDRYNLQVRNGFVHEVNGIMDIYEPENILTVFESTDFVNFQQVKEYRAKEMQKTQVNIAAKDYAPGLTWKSTPAEKIDAVAYLVYSNTGGGNNFVSDGFRMHQGDCLFVDLGPVGEVTIQTRPIPKGIYKIKTAFRRIKRVGGIFQPLLDGEKLGAEISAYDPEWDSVQVPVLTERIVFEETKPHTFTLKVTKPGEIYWDILIFEPVK